MKNSPNLQYFLLSINWPGGGGAVTRIDGVVRWFGWSQCPVLHDIDAPITFEEVNVAINKLKSGKSPGLNGIPPEAYKVMNSEMRQHVHKYIAAFFKGMTDFDSWHAIQCVPVPKKGDLSDQNKCVASCSWMFVARFSPQLWMGVLTFSSNSMGQIFNLVGPPPSAVKMGSSHWKCSYMHTKITTYHHLWCLLI